MNNSLIYGPEILKLSKDKKTYSLYAISKRFKAFIDEHFITKHFWIVAEVTKHGHKSGHHYLELADADEEGRVIAKAQATIWARNFNQIDSNLKGETNSILTPGNKVLILATFIFHEQHGLKLNIIDVDPSITYGDVEKKKKQTIEKLKSEGIFSYQKSIYLPPVVKRIAIVSSKDSSGIKDFIKSIQYNNYFTNFIFKVFHTSVQGDYAANEICNALVDADSYDVDVVVLIRGGGSKMDLNVFNDYAICKTICEMKHPVITGIGHETDETVADLVARLMCFTPTAVAQVLYTTANSFMTRVNEFEYKFLSNVSLQLQNRNEYISNLSKSFALHSQNRIGEIKSNLQNISFELQNSFKNILNREKSKIDAATLHLKHNALNITKYHNDAVLNNMQIKVVLNAKEYLQFKKATQDKLEALLINLDPNKLLNSGYSVLTIDGKNDFDIQNIVGKEMKTLTNKGIIYSTITKTNKNGN